MIHKEGDGDKTEDKHGGEAEIDKIVTGEQTLANEEPELHPRAPKEVMLMRGKDPLGSVCRL